MRQKRLLLPLLLVPVLLLTLGKITLWAQCSTCTFTATTGGSYNLTGNQTLCVTGNVSNIALSFTGSGNKVCVAPGATWTIGSGVNFNASLTIDVYGTLVANGSYNVNGTTPLPVFNIKQGGVMNTNTGGFGSNIRINNEGTLNFTSTASISNNGSFSLINGVTGVVSATATSLFLLGTNSYVENANQMTFSNLENSESDIRNAQGATITIGRYFFNHGQVINDGLINTICGPFGSAACEFIVGDKGPGKIFSITSLGCMKVVGNTRFDGPGYINGTLEITGNLDINKPVSGTNGRIIVNNGVSTIALSGAYNGTNMKFCDKNTTGNRFDAVQANNPSTNVVYTVDCSPNTCGETVAPACALTLTAAPGTCNAATNLYTVTGLLSFTNVPAGTITLSDASGSTPTRSLTVSVPASTTSLTYSFSGLTSGGRIHTLTATFSNTACAPKSLTYLSPLSCTAAACVGTNLLLNPSFEQGFPSPPIGQQTQVPPPSWIGGTADNNPNSFAATDGYAYGFSGDNGATLCQSVSATPGGTYNLSFFTGVHAPNGQTVTLSFLNGSTVLTPVRSFTISHILDIVGGNGTFGGPYSLSGVAPAGATQARVCAVSGNGTGYLYWAKIDNLCLTAQAPVCSLSAVATRTNCNSATNAYTATVVVSLTNTAAGTLTVSIPGATPISQTIAANTTSFSAVFNGLISNGLSHTATVSLPGCGTTTAVYTAPASCSVAPPCNLSATVTRTACNSASNGYGIDGVITVTNSPVSQTITLADGSYVRSLTANAGTTTISYSYSNVLQSDGLVHTLTLTSSATACSTFSTTYTAPAACTAAPPALTVVVTGPVCNSVTNNYTATGTVSLTNAVAGSLTITDNGVTIGTVSLTAGQTTAGFAVSGVSGSTPPSHTVVASLGTATASTTYATPASCTVCSLSLTTSTLPKGRVSAAYRQTIIATGGTLPYTFSVAAGTLPAGLSLDPTTGVLSGTPTTSGTFPTTIVVTDSYGCAAYLSLTTFQINAAPQLAMAVVVNSPVCNSANNTYTATGTVSLTNSPAGSLSITDGGNLVVIIPVTAGQTTANFSLTGLSHGPSVQLVSALLGTTSASTTYTTPASCTSGAPDYAIAKTVSQNRVEKGAIVTYTVSLTNIGNATGTNLVVGDQLSRTEVTFIGSATTSTGTFVPSGNSGNWNIASLSPGQIATLSFQVQINAEGTTYNTATAPDGKTVVSCLTVPFHVCANQPFEFRLNAPVSLNAYQWSRNGVLIPGATSAVYSATVVGDYTVTTTNTAGCADGSCCPLVIVADPAPSLSAVGIAASCTGGSPLNDASISLVSSSTDAVSYNISLGSSFSDSAPLFTSSKPLSGVIGGLLLTNQANPVQAPGSSYTVRVYAANGCYSDVVVVIPPAQCVCPPAQCVPILIKRLK